jgi:hypothetical protein
VTRRPELDALRGLMLILMAVTHLPTRYSNWLSQPFGFVSAAEGFVFLSAYMVGAVYTRRAIESGAAAMRQALWRRAGLVWLCQVGMLLFLFTLIAKIGLQTDRRAIKNLISFYLEEPIDALWSSLVMIYNPPLLDILPMYVVNMLASPLALSLGLLRNGWYFVITGSLALWVLAQFSLIQPLYKMLINAIEPKMPFHQSGAFDLFAWQFVWVLGMWMGSRREALPARRTFPGWLVGFSVILAITCLIWRHIVGQAPFGSLAEFNALFDKWHLGPLRVLNFFVLLVVVIRFGPHLLRQRYPILETLGRASLPVFCAHIVIVLLVLSVIGDRGRTPLWIETALLLGTLVVLYAVALVSNQMDREQRAERKQQKQAMQAAVSARTGG